MIHTNELPEDVLDYIKKLIEKGDLTEEELGTLKSRAYYLTRDEQIQTGVIKLKKKRKFI